MPSACSVGDGDDLGTALDLAVYDQIVAERKGSELGSHLGPGNTNPGHLANPSAFLQCAFPPAQRRCRLVRGDMQRNFLNVRLLPEELGET